MSTLASKAMIVTCTISCWTARKQDKSVSKQVEQAHGAHDAGRYNKLLVDKSALDPLTSYAGAVRQTHYQMTLPWMDNGGRLLPSKLFMEYRDKMTNHKAAYERLVQDFKAQYPALVQAARNRLGTMYEPADYPDVSELDKKFGIELDFTPVPNGVDFRVDIGQVEIDRIRNEITQRNAERQQQAMADAWNRVRHVLSTLYERLSSDKPIIRESLMENTKELVSLLPGLNVTDDPHLYHVTGLIANQLVVDTWTLRNSKSTRKQLAQQAEQILALLP